MAVPTVTISPNDVLEDENGNALDFGSSKWSSQGTWSGLIQAKSTASAGIVSVTLSNGLESVETEIEIVDDVDIQMDVSSDQVNVDESFTLNVQTVCDGFDELPRAPRTYLNFLLNGVATQAVTVSLAQDSPADNLRYSLSCSASGELTIQVVDVEPDGHNTPTVLKTDTVFVGYPATKANLAEAINERLLIKNGSAGTYTDSSTLEQLRGGAVQCLEGFANGDVNADGTYTAYNNTSAGNAIALVPGDPGDYDAWILATYQTVCAATTKSVASNKFSANHSAQKGSGTGSTLSEAYANAESAFATPGSFGYNGDHPRCYASTYLTNNSDAWGVEINWCKTRYKWNTNPGIACTVMYYAKNNPLTTPWTFDGCGFIPGDGSSYRLADSFVLAGSGTDYGAYVGTSNYPSSSGLLQSGSSKGFYADYKFVAKYHFKHR